MHKQGLSDMPVRGGNGRAPFAKYTSEIIDEFIAFAEASGGWATFETLAEEARREGRMRFATEAEREVIMRETRERIETEFREELLKRKATMYVNLQEWAKPREGMTLADLRPLSPIVKPRGCASTLRLANVFAGLFRKWTRTSFSTSLMRSNVSALNRLCAIRAATGCGTAACRKRRSKPYSIALK